MKLLGCRIRLRSHLGLPASGLEAVKLTAEPPGFGFCGTQPHFQGGAPVWLLGWRWRGRREDGTQHGFQHGPPLVGVEVGQRSGSAALVTDLVAGACWASVPPAGHQRGYLG